MANKYRINGKFTSFKEYIKYFGLDSVNYITLSTHEKKIWTGVETYQNRIVLKNGQFLNKEQVKKLSQDKELLQFAKNNKMNINEYLKENIDAILDFRNSDFEKHDIVKNQNNVFSFVQNTNFKLFYFGAETTKNNLIQDINFEIQNKMSKKNAYIFLFYFKFKNNSTLDLYKIEYFNSNYYKKKK